MELPENKLTDFIQGDEKAKWRPINNHNIKEFTEDEIKSITNNYSTPIGKGGFGHVYQGVLDDGSKVAVKQYIFQNLKQGFAKEITVHCQINHRNVVRLLGYCSEENALMMVTEYVPGGNLKDLLHGNDDPISLDARLGIALECAEALGYMHSSMYQPVIHGDIKPDNILLDSKLGVRLTDFGISRLLSMDSTQYTMHVTGSRGYLDPEHMETGRVDPKNDVYSFGVVLLELITRAKASENGFGTGLTANFTQALAKGRQKAREMLDTEITNASNMKVLDDIGKLASECLRRNIKERPEMKDVTERLRMLRKKALDCQEKTRQWSLWGGQDKVVSRQKKTSISSSSSSNSTVLDATSNSNARQNFLRNGGAILEMASSLMIFTKVELKKISNNYSESLGWGSFSKEYKGTLPDGTIVAVMVPTEVNENGGNEFAERVIIQKQMIHTNILKLVGCCLEVDVPILVYEFAAKGSLQNILHAQRVPLPLDLRLDIAVGSAEGLRYMHAYATDQPILHGYIRPCNILLDDRLTPKISYFDFSKFLQVDGQFYTDIVLGSMACIDPVFLQTGVLTLKSDVYSFGAVLLELITRKPISYDGHRNLIGVFCKVFREEKMSGRAMFDLEIATEEDIPILDEIGKLAIECLAGDLDDRPDMTEVAERLMMLRRDRKHGKAGNISSRHFDK